MSHFVGKWKSNNASRKNLDEFIEKTGIYCLLNLYLFNKFKIKYFLKLTISVRKDFHRMRSLETGTAHI
jgi:hypothetical protein